MRARSCGSITHARPEVRYHRDNALRRVKAADAGLGAPYVEAAENGRLKNFSLV
jgi:hypothetical protein